MLIGPQPDWAEKNLRSLRFNSGDSDYLSRTPSVAGNRKTWTWSGWVKRSPSPSSNPWASIFTTNNNNFILRFESDTLRYYDYNGSAFASQFTTTSLYRDYSAWTHVVFVHDSTSATGSERLRLYVNGIRVTIFNSISYPALNADSYANNSVEHRIGADAAFPTRLYDGYMADIHFIDGQALDPSNFGYFDENGIWQPKRYFGPFGTNGFFLNLANNSSTTALGYDTTGNNNHWTPNNFSVTAGPDNDSLFDHPRNFGIEGRIPGGVRGNYCTMNPLANNGGTLSNGNIDHSGSSAITSGTIFPSSGKWYCEITCSYYGGGGALGYTAVGVIKSDQSINTVPTSIASVPSGLWVYRNDALKINNGASASYGNTWTTGDVIGVAFDVDAGKLWFAKNGTWQASGDPAAGTNAAYTNLSGSIGVAINDQGTYTTTHSLNAGARPFDYTAPSGFKALCTQNLPDPTIADPSTVMDVALYTGNGGTQTISGLGFSPDLVWIKSRSNTYFHNLLDTIRGGSLRLSSNNTDAENDGSAGGATPLISAFNSDGFTLPNGNLNTNATSATYAAWCWDAGSSTVTNNDGSITSQVRANPSAGFSIVTFTGNGSTGTVGHGLGASPAMIIQKPRSSSGSWAVYHTSLGAGNAVWLNLTDASGSYPTVWNSTAPTSSVYSVGSYMGTLTYVAYCFAPVEGYSAFGSYTGNGNADGPFVYTGFRPRWILVKRANGLENWYMYDTARDTYNVCGTTLIANLTNAETYDGAIFDLVSNGFKVRNNYTGLNGSAEPYIYAAFAENPFKYSRAR